MTPDKDFDTLVKELQDNNEWVACPAAEALCEMDDPRLIPHFLRELDYNTRQAHFDQVVEERRKRGGRTWMLGYNAEAIADLRRAAARGLHKLLGAEVVPIFIKFLQDDPDFDVGGSIAHYLSLYPSDEMVKVLDRYMARAHKSNTGMELVYILRAINRIDTPKAKQVVEDWQVIIGHVL